MNIPSSSLAASMSDRRGMDAALTAERGAVVGVAAGVCAGEVRIPRREGAS